MDSVLLITGLLSGLAVGGWFAHRGRRALEAATRRHHEEVCAAAARERDLELALATARASAATDEQMLDAFRSVSSEALATQSQQLVQLAEAKYGTLQQNTDTVLAGHGRTVADGLQQLADRLATLERERTSSTVELRTLVQDLSRVTTATKEETAKLASAMRDNRVRGAWGEVQLRRVLELAGLARHADFVEQRGVGGGDSAGRPDVVIPLANGRCVVIDAKVPLDRYLEAADATDPDLERQLQVDHAKAVSGHVKALAARDYAGKVDGSVDMVLMFLPGEPFLAAALDADPNLFESAATKGIHLVTPSSLVPVLRGIALGWREHQAEQAAAEIHALGVELHDRIGLFADLHAKVGIQLERTVDAYNKSVGSLERRVLSTARKLAERGASSTRELPEATALDVTARSMRTGGSAAVHQLPAAQQVDPTDEAAAEEPTALGA